MSGTLPFWFRLTSAQTHNLSPDWGERFRSEVVNFLDKQLTRRG